MFWPTNAPVVLRETYVACCGELVFRMSAAVLTETQQTCQTWYLVKIGSDVMFESLGGR